MEIKTGNFIELKRELYISEKAIWKLKEDRFIREPENKKWYKNKILTIAINPKEYPQEKLGKFSVGPRGHEKRRIAWHIVASNDIIKVYIDDLLYHDSSNNYAGNWDVNAVSGRIKPDNYKHTEFRTFEQVLAL